MLLYQENICCSIFVALFINVCRHLFAISTKKLDIRNTSSRFPVSGEAFFAPGFSPFKRRRSQGSDTEEEEEEIFCSSSSSSSVSNLLSS